MPRFSTQRFKTSALPWIALGFNVIPARLNDLKVPAVKFKELYRPDSPRISADEYEDWFERFDDANALVLWSSRSDGCIAVVDADGKQYFDVAEDVFGENPYHISTGRPEGGRHYLYKVSDPVRSRNRIVEGIDVKCWGGYTVAPGAIHKTGMLYRAQWHGELTVEELPEFPVERYEELRASANKGVRRATKRKKADISSDWVTGDPISADEVVVVEGGKQARLGDLKDGTRFHAADRDDAHPSATIWVHKSGVVWACDWGTNTRRRVQEIAKADPDPKSEKQRSRPDFIRVKTYSTTQHQRDSDYRACARALEIECVEVPEGANVADYAGGLEPVDCEIVVTDTGSGKTEFAHQISKSKSVLAVCPWVLLCHSMAERLDCHIYKESAGWGKIPPFRVVTTLNSMAKLRMKPRDLFIIDEADAVRDFAHTKLFRDGAKSIREMLAVSAASKRIILAEAAMDPRSIQWWVNEYRKRKPDMTFRILYQKASAVAKRQAFLVKNRTAQEAMWEHVTAKKAGEPMTFIASTRADWMRQYAAALRIRRPDLKVLLLTGEEGDHPDVQELLLNPNSLADFDVVFASPVVASGISITALVDRVFLLHKFASVQARNVAQALARCRNVQDPRVMVGVDMWGEKEGITLDMDEIQQIICCQAQKDEKLYSLVEKDYISDKLTMIDTTFMESAKLTKLYQNENRVDRIGKLVTTLEIHGYEVGIDFEDHGDDDVWAEIKEYKAQARELLDQTLIDETIAADGIDTFKAAELRVAYQKTSEEQSSLLKHDLADFYKGTVDEDMIRRDGWGVFSRRPEMLKPGKLRRQASKYVDVWMVEHATERLIESCMAENTNKKKLCQPPERTHRARRAEFNSQLIEAALEAPLGDKTVWLSQGDVAVRIIDFLESCLEDFAGLVETSLSTGEEVVNWFDGTVRGMGCSIHRDDGMVMYDWEEIQDAALLRIEQLDRTRARNMRAIQEVA